MTPGAKGSDEVICSFRKNKINQNLEMSSGLVGVTLPVSSVLTTLLLTVFLEVTMLLSCFMV
jgi:hypothetical protein